MFGFSGENLTKRLRSKGFQSMLKQEIAWQAKFRREIATIL
jgi:hypothetical protein